MNYQLTDEATRDIKGILQQSAQKHGLTQARQYFESLKKCIELLAKHPNMGHRTDDILSGYLRFPHKSHIIFYTIQSDTDSILIIRILHQHMNIKTHIK